MPEIVPNNRRRNAALVATLVLCAVAFVVSVGRHAPVPTWLSLRYALCWTLVALFSASCLAVGHVIVRSLTPTALDLHAHLVVAFAVGVLTFASTTFIAGVLGLLGGTFFILAPLAILALAGPTAFRDLAPRIRAAWTRRGQAPRQPAWRIAIVFLGMLGVLLVYLPILAPANVSFDSRWYHLSIAEQYAADGAIRRFPEGLLAGTYPELATLIYTWAFLSPGGGLFDHVELAAHLEFAVFLAMLAGIPVLVQRLLPGVEARWSWATFFLFPAIFVYDSELCCGADHFAALFAIPIFVASFAAWECAPARACALVAVTVAGAVSTKYTAVSLAIGPTIAIVVRAIQLRSWKGLAAFAATSVAITAQHWLRNWCFYGDPIYPMLAGSFHPRPWTVDSATWHRTFHAINFIPGTILVHDVVDLLRVFATFSVDVHDFPSFHGKVPVFGSLFTIATLSLPFLTGTRRVWGVVLATYAGMSFWAVLSPQDRYLQALLPWMVGATTATLLLAWRVGKAARAAVSAVVGLQVLWAGDAYFLPSHAMTRAAPVQATLNLFGSRYSANGPDGRTPLDGWPEIGRALPRGARVLLHEQDVHLGMGAAAVLDYLPFSYGIDYGRMRSMRQTDSLLRSMGVSHIVWQSTSRRADSVAGDLVFFSFAIREAKDRTMMGPYALASMPDAPPPDSPFGSVVVVGCAPGPYESGVYDLDDLAVPPVPNDSPSRYPAPRRRWLSLNEADRLANLADAEFVVAELGCVDLPRAALQTLEPLAVRGPYTLYLRRP